MSEQVGEGEHQIRRIFLPVLRPSSLNDDGSRNRIHTADVHGRFVRARRIVFVALVAIYIALPTVKVNGYPALMLDVPARRFHLLGAVYNAFDVWRLAFALLVVAFALLFATAALGRVWCGWACPQTVFLEGFYRPIERLFEGSRGARQRLEHAPLSTGKALRKIGKHAGYLAVSLLLAHVALGIFVSLPSLFRMVREGPRLHAQPFAWMCALTIILYVDFAWFREQLCLAICPYGRLQSLLLDRDSLLVGYDERRGEPRGKAGDTGAADCIDCRRCVVVCPTGIDIREGLQMECLGCAQCIDACDEVMDKLSRPRGLIRYDSLRGLAGEKKRLLRPRVLVYGALFFVSLGALAAATLGRHPFDATILRAKGAPYTLDGDRVRNVYELHLVNKHSEEAVFAISVVAPPDAQTTITQTRPRLAPLESTLVPVVVTMPRSAWRRGSEIEVDVLDEQTRESRQIRARFLGPTSP